MCHFLHHTGTGGGHLVSQSGWQNVTWQLEGSPGAGPTAPKYPSFVIVNHHCPVAGSNLGRAGQTWEPCWQPPQHMQ